MNSIRVSPTRLKVWNICQRRWYLSEVLGLGRDDSARHFAFGNAAHEIAFRLLAGREPPAGYDLHPCDEEWAYEIGGCFADLARESVIEFRGLESEFVVDGEDVGVDGGHYRGRIDAWGVGPDGIPVLIDHKTSANPQRNAMSPSELAADLQAQLYAASILIEIPEASEVRCRWQYLPSKRRAYPLDASMIVEATISRDVAMAAAAQACRESIAMGDVAHAREIPPPYFRVYDDPLEKQCLKHYGCPFIGRCEEIEMSFNIDDLLEDTVAETPKSKSAPAPAPAPESAPEVQPKGRPQQAPSRVQEARDALRPYGMAESGDAILGYLIAKGAL